MPHVAQLFIAAEAKTYVANAVMEQCCYCSQNLVSGQFQPVS